MANPIQALASLLAAGAMLLTQPVTEVTPQNNPDDLLLVNREWRISGDYEPEVRVSQVPGQVRRLRDEAATQLEAMFADCRRETGKQMLSVSGYRDYARQVRIWERKLRSVHGDTDAADAYVARPGASEHQTGLTMDVGERGNKDTLGEAFGDSVSGQWMRENAWRYGFILRYDQGWEEITGYAYEPWHFRYVGVEHAARIHELNIPLEEYLLIVRRERLLDKLTAGDTAPLEDEAPALLEALPGE